MFVKWATLWDIYIVQACAIQPLMPLYAASFPINTILHSFLLHSTKLLGFSSFRANPIWLLITELFPLLPCSFCWLLAYVQQEDPSSLLIITMPVVMAEEVALAVEEAMELPQATELLAMEVEVAVEKVVVVVG